MTTFPFCQRSVAFGLFFALPVVACPAARAVTNFNFPLTKILTTQVNGTAILGRDNSLSFNDSKGHPYNPVITFGTVGSTRGGIVNQAILYNSSSLTLTAGFAIGQSVNPKDTSTFNMTGGTVGTANDFTSDVLGSIASTINVSGGLIGGGLFSSGGSVRYSGGSLGGRLSARGACSLIYSGGSVGPISVGGGLYAGDSAIFNILGTNLTATFVASNVFGAYDQYSLTGTLNDNTSLTGQFMFVQSATGAQFQFNGQPALPAAATPAPGSLLISLVGFAGVGFGLRRKCRK